MKTMMNKQLSKKAGTKVPTGPSNGMQQRQASNQQKPGVSSQEHSNKKTRAKIVAGPSNGMVGKTTVKTAKPA